MPNEPETGVREKRPASRAEWVLSFVGLGCLVIGGSGIAGELSMAVFAVAMLIGFIVMHMTSARLHLRIPVEFGFFIIIPVMAILAAAFFPLFSYMRAHGQQSTCASSMKMIGGAIEGYCQDWDGKLPPGSRWSDLILKGEMNDFRDFCPHAPGGLPSYALNGRLEGRRLEAIPGDTVLLFECRPGRNRSGGPELLPRWDTHPRGINVLFADGTVKCVHHSQIRNLKWRP